MVRKVVAKNTLFDQVAQQVAQGHQVEVPTKGNSMLPFIVGGKDRLILFPVDQPHKGDIVLAKINGSNYVVHRIIEISGDDITLMGDGNIIGKEYCLRSEICAKVKYIVHKEKKIDCTTPKQLRRAALWARLLPLRRYILAIWRRLV